MYGTILLTLDKTPTDRTIIDHVMQLASIMGSRIVLLHVVSSAAAQWLGSQTGGAEVDKSQNYLDQIVAEFQAANIEAEAELAFGDPVTEIIAWVAKSGCDLVAMATHGHGFMADMILGTTAINVQHCVHVPVLLLRAK